MQLDGQGVEPVLQQAQIHGIRIRHAALVQDRLVIGGQGLVPRHELTRQARVASCNLNAVEVGHKAVIVIHEELGIEPLF